MLNNLEITFKFVRIVALMAMATIGVASFASVRLKAVGDNYSDLVDRVGTFTSMTVLATSQANAHIAATFELAAETADAGNAKYLERAHLTAAQCCIDPPGNGTGFQINRA
ncbi:MAG TPA: hypothetical protein VGC77_12890 [Rhodopseudomonas sp.]|uniref:hypothetical protein n=1 Tax=Rhodopseudomonas sp. TaxID=1078 RepID=UPI002EDA7215